jgi:hypothetical protein
MYNDYPTYNLDLNSLKEFAELRCLRILGDIADDRAKAFANSEPIKIDYSLFDYSDGKFRCPYIPLKVSYE